MPKGLITVAETAVFRRQAREIWNEEEHDEFVLYIAGNPEAGAVIQDTGGVRKVRWRKAGSGKRGGVRVVYFFYDPDCPLYLLMVYPKGRKDDLDADDKRAVRELAMTIKKSRGKGKSKRP